MGPVASHGVNDQVFLHSLARLLFLAHAVLGAALTGLSTHVALSVVGSALSGKAPGERLRRFVVYGLFLTLAVLLVGFLIYPEYKANIRVAFLNDASPATGRLFDIKEYLAVLSAPIAFFLAAGAENYISLDDVRFKRLYAACAVMWTAMIWAVAVIGWYTSSVRSLGPP